jgi:hypothetical protein
MDTNELIRDIRASLDEVQKGGQKFVSIEALIGYLSTLGGSATVSADARKLQHDSALAKYRADHESSLEMFRAVLESAKTALTSCILVNGGATVALLAYVGNLLSNNPRAVAPHALVLALVEFAFAVLLSAFATGLRYIGQAAFAKGQERVGNNMIVATTLLVVAAYVLFGFGVWNAYVAFS